MLEGSKVVLGSSLRGVQRGIQKVFQGVLQGEGMLQGVFHGVFQGCSVGVIQVLQWVPKATQWKMWWWVLMIFSSMICVHNNGSRWNDMAWWESWEIEDLASSNYNKANILQVKAH